MNKTNKSILVIDTPISCRDCKLVYDNYGLCDICVLTDDNVNYYCGTNTKPEWCPLSPIPEEMKQDADKEVYDTYSLLMSHYVKGWNECREAIMKGKE